jgi:hypothetical protein
MVHVYGYNGHEMKTPDQTDQTHCAPGHRRTCRSAVLTTADIAGAPRALLGSSQTILRLLRARGAPVAGTFWLSVDPGYDWTADESWDRTVYTWRARHPLGPGERNGPA